MGLGRAIISDVLTSDFSHLIFRKTNKEKTNNEEEIRKEIETTEELVYLRTQGYKGGWVASDSGSKYIRDVECVCT